MPLPSARRALGPLLAGAQVALAACGSDEPSGPPTPTSLTIVGGDNQAAPVGTSLPAPIVVQVRSQQGPMSGVSVSFAVDAGGGSVTRASVVTDAMGTASTGWFLGPTLGEQRLRVSAGTLPALTVRATAQIGAASLLSPVAGNSQFAVVGRPVPIRPKVRVTDGFGNPIAGRAVVFSVLAGGGRITDSVHTTDASGEAELGSWTLGPAAGPNRLSVASEGLQSEIVAFGIPALLLAVEGDGQAVNAGTLTPVRPAVQALDGDGAPLTNVSVFFAVESGGGSVLGASSATDQTGVARVGGWILGLPPGANSLVAQVTGMPPTRFTATGVQATPAGLAVAAGDGLTGFFGNFLGGAPMVRVTDAQGNPVAGSTVTFEVTSGGGSVADASPRSDFDGRASLGAWRLGPSEAGQSVRATVAGLAPVTFTATATAPPPGAFSIEVRFLTTPTPAQQAAFDAAKARWQSIILGDLTDILVNFAAGGCLPVAMNETVDDIVIFAEIVDIDGVGNVLGSAGPCLIRSVSGLTVVGRMRFDAADVANLETSGRLEAVILHEMGHVLGIGTLWDFLGLLEGRGGGDPFFTGVGARAAFAAAAAPLVFAGNAVPVENTGGSGTRDVHWRETVLDNELMTGFLDQGANPLSAITSTSLRDLGYVVDDVQSDPYNLPAFLRALEGSDLQLREVPLPWPISVISRSGRIERVIFR